MSGMTGHSADQHRQVPQIIIHAIAQVSIYKGTWLSSADC
jgi:hypothetical protein